MDRETVLKHSKAIRLEHKLLPDFTELVAEFCTLRGHPEYTSVITQLLQHPIFGGEIIDIILTYFEKEYHIIKLERLPNAYTMNQKQLIALY